MAILDQETAPGKYSAPRHDVEVRGFAAPPNLPAPEFRLPLIQERLDPRAVVLAIEAGEALVPFGLGNRCGIGEPPEEFLGAVGAHYLRFPQVEDDEVIKLLGSL